ncbi:MAG: hypothetical protein RML72_08715 [Bacteroidia bacterium]|nr:hypothetical protein [Bacteroidia bacterium]MDW8158936.1 hypothetical protein [Bacteroidia bacterium]
MLLKYQLKILILLTSCSFILIVNAQTPEVVWVAQIDPSLQFSVEQALKETSERKRLKFFFSPQDTLHNLHKFLDFQEPILEIDCFIPNLKIIYRRYTYLISTHCGKILKFENKAPFEPAPIPLATDFLLTLSSLDYLQRFQQKYFFTAYQSYFEQLEQQLPSAKTIFLKRQAGLQSHLFLTRDSLLSTLAPTIEVGTLINYNFSEDHERDTIYQNIEQKNLILPPNPREALWEIKEDWDRKNNPENFWKRILKSIQKLFAPQNRFIHYRR